MQYTHVIHEYVTIAQSSWVSFLLGLREICDLLLPHRDSPSLYLKQTKFCRLLDFRRLIDDDLAFAPLAHSLFDFRTVERSWTTSSITPPTEVAVAVIFLREQGLSVFPQKLSASFRTCYSSSSPSIVAQGFAFVYVGSKLGQLCNVVVSPPSQHQQQHLKNTKSHAYPRPNTIGRRIARCLYSSS